MPDTTAINEMAKQIMDVCRVLSMELKAVQIKKTDLIKSILKRVEAEKTSNVEDIIKQMIYERKKQD